MSENIVIGFKLKGFIKLAPTLEPLTMLFLPTKVNYFVSKEFVRVTGVNSCVIEVALTAPSVDWSYHTEGHTPLY